MAPKALRLGTVRWSDAMAVIVRAVEGVSGIPAGFPILLDDKMVIIESAFAFLLELATVPGRSHSPETLRTYAEHLHDWFDSLEQSAVDWREASEETIAAYRNRMLEQPSPHTGRPYARSTINDRVRSVCRFYGWVHRRGWIAELPFQTIDVRILSGRKQSFLAHVDPRPTVTAANVLTISEYEKLPRPLRVDQLKLLLANLAMPYRLMAEWAVATGLRRKELCGLIVAQVPTTSELDAADHPLVGMPLVITKGDRPRTAYVPIRLIDRTHWYIGEDRASLVRRFRRSLPEYRPPMNLFLNRHGVSITRARLTAAFAAAFRAARLDGSLHCLRHTFATTMLMRLQAQAAVKPDINPLKVLQILLGHGSIQTTAIYLRCVELHAREIAASLDYLYGSAIIDGV
jgi:site-specific recombinase XerD